MTALQSRGTRAGPATPCNDPGADESAKADGTPVASLLAGLGITDEQKVAHSGIVVTGSAGNGSWQYSTDPATWIDFGKVSSDSTLLLDSASRVRYLPGGRNREIARLTSARGSNNRPIAASVSARIPRPAALRPT
jgi:trimeric autotransporter adhesin